MVNKNNTVFSNKLWILGEYYYPDGKIFKGNWMYDYRHGDGLLYFTNGKEEKGVRKNGSRVDKKVA